MHRDLVTLYFLSLTGGRSQDKVSFLQAMYKEHGEQIDYFAERDSLQTAAGLSNTFSSGIKEQWLIDPIPREPVGNVTMQKEEVPVVEEVVEEKKA